MPILIEFEEIAGLSKVRQTHRTDAELFEIFNKDQREVDFLEVSIADDRALEDFSRVEVRDFITRLLAQTKLTASERKILRLWMIGETFDCIAKRCRKNSRESVRLALSNIIRKLRITATQLGEQIDIQAPINFRQTRTRKRLNR